MSVTVTKTATGASITWDQADDPHGYIIRAVQGDQLAYALEALGRVDPEMYEAEGAKLAACHTTALARLLERRAAMQVVQLRDHHGMTWREIAAAVLDAPERQSSVRRMYESGRRHLGH